MAQYPSVQSRARVEIQSYFKAHRQSDLVPLGFSEEERAALPYTVAVLRELVRWVTVAPSGIPHATSKEDEYNGWRIPKGATVIVSLWCVSL
jgi:cytochrome P450